ncbi:hypothetical protein [Rubrimonas cliftonensis]|uniref:Uncharacterized protein n=1 Tax=Rubrimonas cliftonensis TaxID=89524 RepID=A0A1H4FYG2_9RHOB|nr:hypothetical protein [Rubrimonas cliftonensis]SEB02147.1 hypothetical protein SAMN05444370_1319 [Rubrimonas cliftonensis]
MHFIIPGSALRCVAPISVTAFRTLLALVAFDATAAEMDEPPDQAIAWPLRDVASAAGFSASNAARTLRGAASELAAHPWVETIDLASGAIAWRLHPALRPRLWYDEPYLRATLDDFRACSDVLDVQLTLVHRLISGMRQPQATCTVATLLALRGLANDQAGWAALRPALRTSAQRLATATMSRISVTLQSDATLTPQVMKLRIAPANAAPPRGFMSASPLDEHWVVSSGEATVRRPKARRIVAAPAAPPAYAPKLEAPNSTRPLLKIAQTIRRRGVGFVDVRVMLTQLLQLLDERAAIARLDRIVSVTVNGSMLKILIENDIKTLSQNASSGAQQRRSAI